MTIKDGKVSQPAFSIFVKVPNKWERRLGWFWFKGKKIGIRNDTGMVEVVHCEGSVSDFMTER